MSKSKERKKQQTKSIVAGVIAFLIIVAMVVGLITPFVNGAELDDSQIDCQIQFGYDSQYKVNLTTPVYAYITNNGNDFKGSLQVKVRISQEEQEPAYDVHEFPLDLPRGSSKVIDASMVYPTIVKDFEAYLVNEKGTTVKTVKQSVKAMHMTQVLVGVLGDSPSNLSYLKKMIIGGSLDGLNDRTVIGDKLLFLDDKTLPSNIQQLLNYNLLIINDYDTAKLTDEQITSLEQYVLSGGQLVLSDGVNKGKVLDKLGFINNSGEFAPLYSDFKSSIKQLGKGKVLIHEFNMSLASFTENAHPSASDFLTQMYNANLEVLRNETYFSYNNSMDLYYITDRIPMESPGIIYVILTIVFLYALFIGIVIYPMLRKKDKSSFGFIFIPTATVVVTVIIFILSMGTVYKKPIVNSVSQTFIEEGVTNAKMATDSLMLSPKSGNMTVDMGDMDMTSIYDSGNRGSYYYYYPSTNYKNNIRTKYIYGSDERIIYYQTSAWEKRRIGYSANVDLGGAITTDLNLSGNRIIGTIANGTDHDFDDVIIGIDYDVEIYHDLKAGETVTIDQEINTSILSGAGSGYVYDKLDKIYSYNDFNERIKRDVLMQSVYNSYPTSYSTSYSSSNVYVQKSMNSAVIPKTYSNWTVKITMFDNHETKSSTMKIDGLQPTNFNLNVYTMAVPLNIDVSGKYEIFHGLLKISGLKSDDFIMNFDGNNNGINLSPLDQVSTQGEVYVDFDLSELKNINSIGINFNSAGQYYLNREIYNDADESWVFVDEVDYLSDNVYDYIDKDGILTLRITVPKETYHIYNPTIDVKGGE